MRTTVLALAALAIAIPAAAQEATPKPGPAHERMAYFVGDWTFEGEAMAGPMGPGGPITSRSECEWFPGNFQVVCNGTGTNPRGEAQMHAIMAYDPTRQQYTYYGMSSMGESFFVPGTVDGKVWTWEDEEMIDGKPMKFRVTLTETSPTSYAFLMEGSYDGSPWSVMERGTSTRQQ